ncbi:hypothetical protein CsatB_017090 [Cannabis sativa]
MHSSWYWRKIIELKNDLKCKITPRDFMAETCKIAEVYKILTAPTESYHWSKQVWSRLNIPKHSFLIWLAVQDRLKTRERLFRFNVAAEATCILCNDLNENTSHLFFDCKFSQSCLSQIKVWLNWRVVSVSLQGLLRWINRSKASKFRRGIFSGTIAALVYHIWKARNLKLWQANTIDPDQVVQEVKWQVKTRITYVMPKQVLNTD